MGYYIDFDFDLLMDSGCLRTLAVYFTSDAAKSHNIHVNITWKQACMAFYAVLLEEFVLEGVCLNNQS